MGETSKGLGAVAKGRAMSSTIYSSEVKIGGVELSQLKLDASNRKHNASVLKAGYTPAKRRFEILTMTVFVALEATIIWRLLKAMNVSQLWLVPLCFLLAEVVTDFVSGVAHWLCDTWGRLDTPIVGPTFIRSFREHHIDPSAICNHDFIETNADPSLFSVALNTYLIFLRPWNPDSQYDMALYLFALFGGLLAAFTNEFHKWSHMHKPPAWIQMLQDLWIVLPRRHHAVHHRPPFDKYYCITSGHLNAFLDGIGFWRRVEVIINTVFGAVPRQDDDLWTSQIYGEKKK